MNSVRVMFFSLCIIEFGTNTGAIGINKLTKLYHELGMILSPGLHQSIITKCTSLTFFYFWMTGIKLFHIKVYLIMNSWSIGLILKRLAYKICCESKAAADWLNSCFTNCVSGQQKSSSCSKTKSLFIFFVFKDL